MKKQPILIIGKTPLPIGGVTIHVQRLLNLLTKNSIDYNFIDMKQVSKRIFFKKVFLAERIHLHSSNVYFRFLLSLFGSITRKKIDFTLHGNLGRHKTRFKNLLDSWTLKLAHRPVLLNESSYTKAIKFNKNAVKGTSFIPPDIKNEILPEDFQTQILELRKETDHLFCTNAYNLTFDKDGEEIYGIFNLVGVFEKLPYIGLAISDPSSAYLKAIKEKIGKLPNNIILLSRPHSFYKVIELCDATIRNTTTDGDSISIKESLYLGKFTFSTNVVSRPKGVIVYKREELLYTVKKTNFASIPAKNTFRNEVQSSLIQLIELYRK